MKQKSRVKFTNKDRSKFFNTLKENVDAYFTTNNLSKHANSTMVTKTVVLMLAYFLPFVCIMAFNPPTWIIILNFSVMGFAMAGIGMSVMHDANHNAYSSNPIINKILGLTLNMMGGAVFNWKMQHNVLHHTYTNIHEMDDDIDSKLLMRFSPHGKHKGIHRFQHIYVFFFYSILTLYWATLKDFIQHITFRMNGAIRGNKWEFWKNMGILVVSKAFYFAYMIVLPVMVFGLSFSSVLIGFLVMHAISGLVLSVIFQLAHTVEGTSYPIPNDKREVENDWAIHQMNTTVDFSRKNKFLTWYLGGLNFQVEHHLFPSVCHVHYTAISEIVKNTAEEFGVPYLDNPSFWGAFRSHIRALKNFGTVNFNEIMDIAA